MNNSTQTAWKQQAADAAVLLIESGMVVGLGSGSTAILAVRRLGELLASGALRNVTAVATSLVTQREAEALRIPLADIDNPPTIDLTIDGADELDPQLNAIKGGGGALLREKITAALSRRVVFVVDESKLSARLGERWPTPIEVIPFAWQAQARFVAELGGPAEVRRAPDGELFRTDQGNLILDCAFGPIARPCELARQLSDRPGIIEHGLFLGFAQQALVGGAGGLRRLLPTSPTSHKS